MNKIKLIIIALVILALAGVGCSSFGGSTGTTQATQEPTATPQPPTPTPTPAPPFKRASGPTDIAILNTSTMTSQFLPGASFIQNDTHLNDPGEQSQLAHGVGYLNVFIYGWGTDDPMPNGPGQYDWSSLDQQVSIMRHIRDLSGGKTKLMISLCCAPDWMKSSSDINAAPNPGNYPAFAELAKQVVERYPDIQQYQVWNELKGFNVTSDYMNLYNDVYDAIKSVRPNLLIGGPYNGISIGDIPDPVTAQWLSTRHGGNFVAIDGGFDSDSASADFSNAHFYTDFGKWLRQQPHGGATLPFGWAEWYPGTSQPWNDENHFNATMANAMVYTLKSGASYALMWGVEGGISGEYKEGDGQQVGLIDSNGPTIWYKTVKDFHDYFGPGTTILTVNNLTNKAVTVLASNKKTMVVNQLGSKQTVVINGYEVPLAPYQVFMMNTIHTS